METFEGQCKVKTRSGEMVWERVVIEIDVRRLAWQLGRAAWKNKSAVAVLGGGAVKVRRA